MRVVFRKIVPNDTAIDVVSISGFAKIKPMGLINVVDDKGEVEWLERFHWATNHTGE